MGNNGWHWIHTGDSRMNIAGCTYEWLFASLRAHNMRDWPADVGGNGPGGAEPGMWIPSGQRRVERVLPKDTLAKLRENGIHCVEVEDIAVQTADETLE